MDFKKFSAGLKSYGKSDPKLIEHEKGLTNVNFDDDEFWSAWNDQNSENYEKLNTFIIILAICHSLIVEKKDGVLIYNANSPDELALTNAARYFGYVFEDRDEDGNIVIYNKIKDTRMVYELLNIIEFTSARKRMTIIVRDPNSKILCITKGADSHIINRLYAGQDELIGVTNDFISDYAREGLRTLMLAQKEVNPEFYNEWNIKYAKAMLSQTHREEEMDKCSEEIEIDFELIGSTAIEDKLQDEVGDTISFIRAAGVKLWVLTGDKIETAINIGFSCKLLDHEMEILIIDKDHTKDIYIQIKGHLSTQAKIGNSRETSVVVGGEQLMKITKPGNESILEQFVSLSMKSTVVLGCRVSPK